MPPLMMTKVIPAEMIARNEAAKAVFRRLSTVAKRRHQYRADDHDEDKDGECPITGHQRGKGAHPLGTARPHRVQYRQRRERSRSSSGAQRRRIG